MLTSTQIGQIAEYIEVALKLHPLAPPDENALCKLAPDNFMEGWERCLQIAIDKDSSLPSYHEVQSDLCLDFLVSYYGG